MDVYQVYFGYGIPLLPAEELDIIGTFLRLEDAQLCAEHLRIAEGVKWHEDHRPDRGDCGRWIAEGMVTEIWYERVYGDFAEWKRMDDEIPGHDANGLPNANK